MSAPSLFDRFVTRDISTPRPARVLDPYPVQQDRRSREPAAVLSRQHEDLVRNATDPLEIAAGLEAAGLSDRRVRSLYGSANVFELADTLFDLVPRRPGTPELPDPWRRPRRQLFARGLVYALPGLLLAGAVQHLSRSSALVLLMVSVMASASNQGLAHLGHLLLGRRKPTLAAALLRRALLASVGAGVEVGLLFWLIGAASPTGAVVAVLAVVYLTSATVVLLLDRHDVLLALLSPAAILGLLGLSSRLPLTQSVALVAAVASLVGAFVAAWRLAGALAGPAGPARGRLFQPGDLVQCLPLVAHGALSMTLLAAIPYAALHSVGDLPSAVGPVMLPAVLSLGAAEVHLFGFRRRADALLRGHHLRHFATNVRLHLLQRVCTYTLLLMALTGAVEWLAPLSLRADPDARAHLATYLLLAVALFVASVLVSTSHVKAVILLELTALIAVVVLQHLPDTVTVTQANLLGALTLATSTIALGAVLLGRVVSHR